MLPDWFKDDIEQKKNRHVDDFLKLVRAQSESKDVLDDVFEDGRTPVIVACESGNAKMLKTLKEFGANLSKPYKKVIVNPWNPEVIESNVDVTPLQAALAANEKECVEYLIRNHVHPSDNKEGLSGLMYKLIEWDEEDVIKFIAGKYFDVDIDYSREPMVREFKLAFLEAIRKGKLSIVNILIKAGINVNFVLDGVVPLLVAADIKHNRICLTLLQHGAYLTGERDSFGQGNAQSPMLLAALGGWKEALKVLIALGGEVNEVLPHQYFKDVFNSINFGDAPILFHVIAKDNVDMTHYLVEELKADVSILSSRKNTILHVAVSNNAKQVFDYLMSTDFPHYGEVYRLINTVNNAGMTPLLSGVFHNDLEVVSCLIKHRSVIDPEDPVPKSALNVAIEYRNDRMVEFLLRNGANPDLGRPTFPLFAAARAGNVTICKILIEYNAKPHIISSSGEENAMHLGVKSFDLDVVRYLLKQKINVNHPNKYGYTPLMVLLTTGSNRSCLYELLLVNGADMESKSTSFNTEDNPMSLATPVFDQIGTMLLVAHGCPFDYLWENYMPVLTQFEFKRCNRPLLLPFVIAASYTYEIAKIKLLIHHTSSDFFRGAWCTKNNANYWRAEDITKILTDALSPRSLLFLVRVSIRKVLCERAPRGKSIMPLVAKLPLPKRMKDVLMLRDVYRPCSGRPCRCDWLPTDKVEEEEVGADGW